MPISWICRALSARWTDWPFGAEKDARSESAGPPGAKSLPAVFSLSEAYVGGAAEASLDESWLLMDRAISETLQCPSCVDDEPVTVGVEVRSGRRWGRRPLIGRRFQLVAETLSESASRGGRRTRAQIPCATSSHSGAGTQSPVQVRLYLLRIPIRLRNDPKYRISLQEKKRQTKKGPENKTREEIQKGESGVVAQKGAGLRGILAA